MMMTYSLRRICPLLGAMLTLACGTSGADAQEYAYRVTAEEPEFASLQSPSIDNRKRFDPKLWLEAEAKIKVEMRPVPKSETCDAITVKWYLAVENPEQANTYLLFTREVKYVNIPVDEEIYISTYLSPASIRRLLGRNARYPHKAVEVCSYAVHIDGAKGVEPGAPLAGATSNKKYEGRWWEQGSARLARSGVIPLLNKSETPFSMLWWDRYAEVAPEQERPQAAPSSGEEPIKEPAEDSSGDSGSQDAPKDDNP